MVTPLALLGLAACGHAGDVPAAASATTQAHGADGTDEDGRPVTAALVTPTSLDTPSKAIPEVAVITDDEGAYSWVLPAGRYRIAVTADGYHEVSGETDVPAGLPPRVAGHGTRKGAGPGWAGPRSARVSERARRRCAS